MELTNGNIRAQACITCEDTIHTISASVYTLADGSLPEAVLAMALDNHVAMTCGIGAGTDKTEWPYLAAGSTWRITHIENIRRIQYANLTDGSTGKLAMLFEYAK